MFKRLVNIGTNKLMPGQTVQYIRLTNILLLLLMGLSILLLFPVLYEDGWVIISFIDMASFVFFVVLLWFNYLGFYNVTRIFASFYPPFVTIAASIIVKIFEPQNVTIYDYFDARILLIGFSILPFVFFSYKEKKLILLAFAVSFFLVVAFDPIHHFFGVGYTAFFGDMPKAYIVSGIYIDIVLLFVTGYLFYFKSDIENVLQGNYALTEDLGKKILN